MGEQRLRVLRQSLKRCCTRSSWLAGTDIVLIGCPPSTVEWTADDTNSISKIHAALPKGLNKQPVFISTCVLLDEDLRRNKPRIHNTVRRIKKRRLQVVHFASVTNAHS